MLFYGTMHLCSDVLSLAFSHDFHVVYESQSCSPVCHCFYYLAHVSSAKCEFITHATKRNIQLQHLAGTLQMVSSPLWSIVLYVCLSLCSADAQVRTRRILQEAHEEGRPCPSQLTQTKPCPIKPCYTWLLSDWSSCTVEVWAFVSCMWCHHH